MANQSDKSLSEDRSERAASDGLGAQLITMHRAFMASPQRAPLLMLFVAVSMTAHAASNDDGIPCLALGMLRDSLGSVHYALFTRAEWRCRWEAAVSS